VTKFRTYVFTEMPYPYIPPEETFESARVTLPNRIYDPELGYQLYQKYFDLYALADQLELDKDEKIFRDLQAKQAHIPAAKLAKK